MRTVRKYERTLLEALGVIDSKPRRIGCKENIDVVCAYCQITTGNRPMYLLMKSFKKNWYGWVCHKCAKLVRKRGCKKFWNNLIKKEITVEKRKRTSLEKYGVDNWQKREKIKNTNQE